MDDKELRGFKLEKAVVLQILQIQIADTTLRGGKQTAWAKEPVMRPRKRLLWHYDI